MVRVQGNINDAATYSDVAATIEGLPYVVAHGLYLNKVHSVVAIGPDSYRTIAPYLKVRAQLLLALWVSGSRARHPVGGEGMGSPTLQPLQEPLGGHTHSLASCC